MVVTIRSALLKDLASITEIYNDAIAKTVATFDTEPKDIDEQRQWFLNHGKKNPIMVAEQRGMLVGWAALSKYSNRCAYADTAELSVYVTEEWQGKGIGKTLIEAVLEKGRNAGLHAIIARVTEGNEKSIHTHKSAGFEHVGILKEVGFKFNKRLDVYILEKILE